MFGTGQVHSQIQPDHFTNVKGACLSLWLIAWYKRRRCFKARHYNLNVYIRMICCIGAVYVDGPTCATIALECPDGKVAFGDLNEQRARHGTW